MDEVEEQFDTAVITRYDFFRLVPTQPNKIECTLCERIINRKRLNKHRQTKEHRVYEADLREVKKEVRVRKLLAQENAVYP
jgi:hypothetical protein